MKLAVVLCTRQVPLINQRLAASEVLWKRYSPSHNKNMIDLLLEQFFFSSTPSVTSIVCYLIQRIRISAYHIGPIRAPVFFSSSKPIIGILCVFVCGVVSWCLSAHDQCNVWSFSITAACKCRLKWSYGSLPIACCCGENQTHFSIQKYVL